MNYRIVGTDGKMYGPVSLDQIRRWLAEGRADSRTPVHVEGAASWTYLGLLPDLAPSFAAHPGVIGAITPSATRGTNGFATAGLICGLLSWTCCCCVPFNLLGIVFSIVALVQLAGQPQPQEGRGFAIAGLILSVTSIGLGLLVGGLQLMMAPNATFSWQTGSN
jgi:hypothetical protein